MEESAAPQFIDQLDTALEQRKNHLEKRELPKLKELYRQFHSAFQALYNLLLRKSLIQEDPYKYEQKISEVTPPPQGPFMESERSEQMSMRLSSLDTQFDFMINYYQFSVDFLNLERIKPIIALTTYIRWDSLSESSTSINTRALAEMVLKLKTGPDSLSVGIANDSTNQMEKLYKEIMGILKQLADYHRESYKAELRRNILSKLNLNGKAVMSRQDDAVKAIRRKFAERMGDMPFYGDLLKEIFEEDYSPQGERLREELIERIGVKEDTKEKEREEISFKAILMDSLRILASTNTHLENASRKMGDNSIILESRKLTFSEKFKRWVTQMVQGKKELRIYEIEYIDPSTGLNKTEKLNMEEFIESINRRVKILVSLTNRMSPTFKRLEASNEESIYTFLNQNIEDIQLILIRLPALETFFKSEVPREERGRLRTTNNEAGAIKAILVKSNQKRHEYVSRKEEIEQLKKLGIDTSVR